MITEDIEHKIGTSQTLRSVQSKEAERQRIARETAEWEARGNEVDRVPSTEWTPEAASFNREGPINPAKYGIDSNFQA